MPTVRATTALQLILILSPGVAAAQSTPDEARRTRLLDDAFNISNTGDHAQAMELAMQAERIRPSPSLQMFLAEEHEVLSRDEAGRAHLLDALDRAERCVATATADTTLRDRAGVLQRCNELVRVALSRTARVRVFPPQPAPGGLTVRINGATLDPARWGAPFSVLPGEIRVDAIAPGYVPFQEVRTLVANTSAGVNITLHLAPASPPPPPPSTSWLGPGLLLGTGGASLVLSGVFYGFQSNAQSERERFCPPDVSGRNACPSDQARSSSNTVRLDEERWNTASRVALGVGLAFAAGGVTWLLVKLSQPASSRHASLRLGLSPTTDGLTVSLGGSL